MLPNKKRKEEDTTPDVRTDQDGDIDMDVIRELNLIARALGGPRPISEIFSPPRVTKHASSMGFKPGLALGFTVLRPDGTRLEFSKKAHRQEARKHIGEDNPILLLGSPPVQDVL